MMDSNLRSENQGDRGENKSNEQIPFMLVIIALVAWFSFQLYQAVGARNSLIQAYNSQDSSLQSANKIRQSLSSLATGAKQLASQGNSNAAQIVNELAQRGIKIADSQSAQPENVKETQK